MPLGATTHQGESDVKTTTHAEIPDFLVELEDAFNKAMISNALSIRLWRVDGRSM